MLKKKCISFLLLSLCGFVLFSQEQVKITHCRNIDSLVKSFLVGNGVLCRNVKFNGSSKSIGTFNFSFICENFKHGLLLSTGEIDDVAGPNNSTATSGNNKKSGDKSLTKIARKKTFDAAVLEFDFISSANKVSFNYFFGSEEYLEYVGSRFNDVFGFFISGPGMKEKNLALLPGKNKKNFVTINNVNHVKNSEFFIDNNWFGKNGKEKKFKKKSLDKDVLNNLQYDGFTKVLKAESNVVPGKVYHIRIAIADAGDGILDSGVFLEKNSFTSEKDANSKNNVEVQLDSLWFSKNNYDGIPIETVGTFIDSPKEKTTLNENIEFDLDKTLIPDSSIVRMKKLLERANAMQTFEVQLFGHADTSGNSIYNLGLSERRSKAVAELLVSIGFPREKIAYKSYGSAAPKISNVSESGRSRNRRVEVVLKEN
jgi:outer membrane protein OmpA-like peptidoglycan-associated protein